MLVSWRVVYFPKFSECFSIPVSFLLVVGSELRESKVTKNGVVFLLSQWCYSPIVSSKMFVAFFFLQKKGSLLQVYVDFFTNCL